MAVCDKTFHLLQRAPYSGLFDAIEPRTAVTLSEAKPFDCRRAEVRDPRETKGANYHVTTESAGPCCGDGEPCC
jgi:hypothetical protein